jgi:hypothetical protein
MPSIEPVKSGPEGFVETGLGNLPNSPGKVLRYRYGFRNSPTCPGQGAFSFSNMVVVQVQ